MPPKPFQKWYQMLIPIRSLQFIKMIDEKITLSMGTSIFKC
jgi:hypothetical protein